MATTPLAQRLYDKTRTDIVAFRQKLADWQAQQGASGFAYGGTATDIFRQMCREYLRLQVADYFEWVEREAGAVSQAPLRRESIEQCVGAIVSYSRQVRRVAMEKDRILRGLAKGVDSGRWDGLDDQSIFDRGSKLIAALGLGRGAKTNERLNHLVKDNPWFFSLLSILAFVMSFFALFIK